MASKIINFQEIGQPIPPVLRDSLPDFTDFQQAAQAALSARKTSYRQARLIHDQEFLQANQQQLQNFSAPETEGDLQQALAPITRFFARNRDSLIAQFRFEYAINPPYNFPSYAEVITFLFEKNLAQLTDLIGPKLHSKVPVQYVLQTLLNDQHLDPDQRIDINERSSVMSFYGQLLAVMSEQDLPALTEIKSRFFPERQNLAKIDLKAHPDLLSELNIYAIRQAFHLRATSAVPEAVKMAGGLDPKRRLDFAAYVLRNYLQPQEYQQIDADLKSFLSMPGKSNWNFLQELLGRTTQRQFLAKLPVNTGQSGENIYGALQTVYFLEHYAGFTTEKGDRDLCLEIAFQLQQSILQTL
jgi:hypothetical protein